METESGGPELLDRLARAVGPVPTDVVDDAKALFARFAEVRAAGADEPDACAGAR